MDESVRLLAFQQLLEKDTDGKVKFIGASINETIIKCVTTGLHKRADKARADWKVPDKRFVFRSHKLKLGYSRLHQVLVSQTACINGGQRLGRLGRIRKVEEKSHRLRTFRPVSCGERVRRTGCAICTEVRCSQACRAVRLMRGMATGWEGGQGERR